MSKMHRPVGARIYDRKTKLVHLALSYDESDNATLARLAGDLGHRTVCGILEGMWTRPETALTCLECAAFDWRIEETFFI